MTPAERHDVVLILRRLSQPCPHGAEHDWMKCPRCLTIEELGHHKGRIFDLMRKAADALAAPPAAPPADLVALVREWQAARKPTVLATPGEFLAETFQAAVRRMSAADEALAACRLDVAGAETPAAGLREELGGR